MERTYCYFCGNKLHKKEPYIWYCGSCDQTFYANPKPCVELAIFNKKGEVLLAERAFDPWKGKYDMPGGFIDIDERAEDALLRELKEEIDLDPEDIESPKFVRTYLSDYPWGRENYKNIVLLFTTKLVNHKDIDSKDDVASVRWVKPKDVQQSELSIAKLYDYIQEAKAALY